ncbi:hypothetical protein SAMN04515674_105301 [Pseudarcicella hirudinis]|uniref:Uncharacterized protein n=1 Tax=Pseudarcicella hirudinis TaxID=1079859 RepID=A0A1I5T0D4_9BACT|nr:hypothetical protein [Pseudarcicella hirudinis]SFP76331.1 hypothetical protein SAMN04515674_105301 [Pseudarcicella hirudinis]
MDEKYKDKALLKSFMKEFFPFSEMRKAGLFTKEMKGNYEAQADKICTFLGYETVYEYGSNEVSCHITYTEGKRPDNEGFVTVLPNIYE